jgi:hypothetical protein
MFRSHAPSAARFLSSSLWWSCRLARELGRLLSGVSARGVGAFLDLTCWGLDRSVVLGLGRDGAKMDDVVFGRASGCGCFGPKVRLACLCGRGRGVREGVWVWCGVLCWWMLGENAWSR